MPRKDPFKTLDDPEPAAAPAAPCCGAPADTLGAGVISTTVAVMNAGGDNAGYWQIPSGRPGWLRRALVRLVLGWKWRKL
jgi:hypothetical protein